MSTLSRYNITKTIGRGKYSVVREAIRDDGVKVALKNVQIFEMMDAEARKICINEVRILQSLGAHPNIIRCMDSFIESNELIIVFEVAERGDLGRMIQEAKSRGAPFGEPTVWRYFYQLCSALQFMHRHRIMHRDIKPANVFISEDGTLKLGDLGMGRHFGSQTSMAHSMVGTPYYMSPELIREQGYSFKSDVWSLGCMIYELATLRSPFEGDGNIYQLGMRISRCEYRPLPPTLSPELRDCIHRILQPDPNDRPGLDDLLRVIQRHTS
eukprot:Rmarinus@m.1719